MNNAPLAPDNQRVRGQAACEKAGGQPGVRHEEGVERSCSAINPRKKSNSDDDVTRHPDHCESLLTITPCLYAYAAILPTQQLKMIYIPYRRK